MKIACWIVVRNDEFYIDMAIKSVLPYVSGIYILDNGSTDKTIDIIKSFKSKKIFLEKIKYKFERPNIYKGDRTATHPYWKWDSRYDGNSLEAQTRNLCIKHCVKRFKPDWLIQLDADEIFTPLFFKQLKNYDLKNIVAIKHSTERFVTKDRLGYNPKFGAHYDPHERSWNPNLGIRWVKQDKKNGHVVPRLPNGRQWKIVWMDGIVHIHLHRTFGPKSEEFWGVKKKLGVPYNPKENISRFNALLKESKPTKFNWDGLEFVINKWKRWGIW